MTECSQDSREIELIGGPCDGQKFYVRHDTRSLVVPISNGLGTPAFKRAVYVRARNRLQMKFQETM